VTLKDCDHSTDCTCSTPSVRSLGAGESNNDQVGQRRLIQQPGPRERKHRNIGSAFSCMMRRQERQLGCGGQGRVRHDKLHSAFAIDSKKAVGV